MIQKLYFVVKGFFIINLIKIIIPGMLLNLLELRYTKTLGVDAADHEQSLDDRVMD